MQAGYLVDLRAIQVLLQADFDALRTQHGDFVEAELETLLLAANAPAQVLAAFQAHAADRKALLFTPTVALGLCDGRHLPDRWHRCRGPGWDHPARDPPGHPPAAAHRGDPRGGQLCRAHRRL